MRSYQEILPSVQVMWAQYRINIGQKERLKLDARVHKSQTTLRSNVFSFSPKRHALELHIKTVLPLSIDELNRPHIDIDILLHLSNIPILVYYLLI